MKDGSEKTNEMENTAKKNIKSSVHISQMQRQRERVAKIRGLESFIKFSQISKFKYLQ